MKSLASLCTALGVFCAVPVSAPPLARGSARADTVRAPIAAPSSTPTVAFRLTATPSGPYSGAPPVTRLQILDIARSALGVRYVHGGESWAGPAGRALGTDCTGLIAKAWQVPHAAETWEELPARPTTETLDVPTARWFKLPIAERRPGDALVRYEDTVRHAFIYERDDADFAENSAVWVYEAAAPRVEHRRYRLSELSAYTLTRRYGIDELGLVGRSRNWIFGDLIDAFRRGGGESVLGTPHDRGHGVLVHPWAAADDHGVAQDFHGGSAGPARLVRSERSGVVVLTGDAATSRWQPAVAAPPMPADSRRSRRQ